MTEKKWLENITPEDMPNEELKIVAYECGMDVAMSLIENVPGINIGVPKSAFNSLIKKYIHKNYDGTKESMLRLALECNVSTRHVWNIVRGSGMGKGKS